MSILTLNTIRKQSPCTSGWETLLKSLNKTTADNMRVSISHLLDSNGNEDTLWVIYNCLQDLPDFNHRHQNMALDLAESVICNYEKQFPQDSRIRDCIAVVRNPNSTIEELESAARSAAKSAESAARSARSAARSAAKSAESAARSARSAAWSAARSAESAAWSAAWSAESAEQKEIQKAIILKWFPDEIINQ